MGFTVTNKIIVLLPMDVSIHDELRQTDGHTVKAFKGVTTTRIGICIFQGELYL